MGPVLRHRAALALGAAWLLLAGAGAARADDPAAAPPAAPPTPGATAAPAADPPPDPAPPPVDAAEPAPAEPAAPQLRASAVRARLLLKVVHPAEARKAIIERAEALGGHATYVADERLRLKVRPERVGELLDAIGAQGLTIEKELGRDDLTEELARLDGGLRSKLEVFGRLRKLLDDAPVSATLAIEKDMTSLVLEIERLKGELRVAEDRVRFAAVEVAFRFERRERLKDARSPFGWLNDVDLDAFLRRF